MPDLHLELASTYLRLGRVQEALRESQAALATNPKDIRSYDVLGTIYAVMHDYDKALDALSRALALEPESIRTHIARAQVYELQGNLDQAEGAYRAAIQADPKSLAPRLALVRSLLRRQQWGSAIQTGQAALAVDEGRSCTISSAWAIWEG
jgi:tetratricopeptide (TPR) repeat protein